MSYKLLSYQSGREARAGILKEFTGISDPYEVPADAEVTINTGELSAEEIKRDECQGD